MVTYLLLSCYKWQYHKVYILIKAFVSFFYLFFRPSLCLRFSWHVHLRLVGITQWKYLVRWVQGFIVLYYPLWTIITMQFFLYRCTTSIFFWPFIVLRCLPRGLSLCCCSSSIEVHSVHDVSQVIRNNTWVYICMYLLMLFFFIDNCYTIFMHPVFMSQRIWLSQAKRVDSWRLISVLTDTGYYAMSWFIEC